MSPPAKALSAQSGAGAVQQSVQQNAMQSNISVYADKKKDAEQQVLVQNSVVSQYVNAKNFQNQNNTWIDAEYSGKTRLPETTVKFASDEYFELINRNRELAQYFSLGRQVTVVWNNRVYKVIE